jgi:uncharacterized damage-inducible protein DinB
LTDQPSVEPWLSGSLTEVPAVPRAVLHALQLAREDLRKWCNGLTDDEINARLGGIAQVAFHLRHIGRSADRLLTYLEGHPLTAGQMAELKSELDPGARTAEVFGELETKLRQGEERVRRIDPQTLDQQRSVGRRELPTTVAGLLIHVAEHTARHVGQAVTTAKLLRAVRLDT